MIEKSFSQLPDYQLLVYLKQVTETAVTLIKPGIRFTHLN